MSVGVDEKIVDTNAEKKVFERERNFFIEPQIHLTGYWIRIQQSSDESDESNIFGVVKSFFFALMSRSAESERPLREKEISLQRLSFSASLSLPLSHFLTFSLSALSLTRGVYLRSS